MDAHPDFEDALSLERFGRYLAWAEGDSSRALELYALNTRLSESLYTPLQMLEVALRNRIHSVMTELHGPAWFRQDGMLLGDFQPGQLHSAVADICRQGRKPSASRIVASLTFGFWTAMFGQAYETLWQQGLHRIARRPDGKGLRRKDFSGPLARIRVLRNRIAHHEPIVHWELFDAHERMLLLTRWLSPAAADWCERHSRFRAELARSGISAPASKRDALPTPA